MSVEETTISDFSGGWNVADNALNLSSKYQPVSENVLRGVDGSVVVRPGMKLKADFKDGVEITYAAQSVTAAVVDTNPYVEVTWTAHGFTSGDHVTITGATDVGGITADLINGTFGILVIDVDTFRIATTGVATSTTSGAQTWNVVHDTHTLSGEIIHTKYFVGREVCFTDIGEVGTWDGTNVARIWSYEVADYVSSGLIPTRLCSHWSSDTFKSTMIACNGYDKDKPIQIYSDFSVDFLVDKATLSNAFVPRADYVICMQGYVIFVRTEYGDPFAEMSARGTDGTFTRDPSPADAVEVDLSLVTSSVEPTLLGAGRLRDKLYLAFYDRGMIGQLGIYTSGTPSLHEPDFADTIAEHGVISHHTLVSLGNDIFMCDYAGVPSVTISQQSGLHVPVRVSELIGPVLQAHLARMSEATLRQKAFAVFDKTLRAYLLFIPKYDEVAQTLTADPFNFNEELIALNYARVYAPNHGLIDRSYVTVAGAVDISTLGAANINGVRSVVSIVDKDNFIIELGGAPATNIVYGGGSSVSITPVQDETLVYVFEFNRELNIRRWTRFRGWNFRCAAVTQRGKVMMASGLKLYQMGHPEEPVFADFYADYDVRVWTTSTSYAEGVRVNDAGTVYICLIAHTSASSGTFAEDREANPDNWEAYDGEAIEWVFETPWSSMKSPGKNKFIKYINSNAIGTEEFSIEGFTNEIYRDATTNQLAPNRAMAATNLLSPNRTLQLIASSGGGYSVGVDAPWGGGRRTRDKVLWPFPMKGKTVLWRISGATKNAFKFVSHTMYYTKGNFR